MGRPKAFDADQALDAAITVFAEHGFAGTSTNMLTEAMVIGRQSLYDSFGDKWRLYCSALQRYGAAELKAHFAALRRGSRAGDCLRHMMERVVEDARAPCLAVGSISEFGDGRQDIALLHAATGRALRVAVADKIEQAQAEGDLDAAIDPGQAASFLIANMAAIRISARAGADDAALQVIKHFALAGLWLP